MLLPLPGRKGKYVLAVYRSISGVGIAGVMWYGRSDTLELNDSAQEAPSRRRIESCFPPG